jgi:hypothetical protein
MATSQKKLNKTKTKKQVAKKKATKKTYKKMNGGGSAYENAVSKLKNLPVSLQNPNNNLKPIYTFLYEKLWEAQSEGDTTYVLEPTDLPEVTNHHDRAYLNSLLRSIGKMSDKKLHDTFIPDDFAEFSRELGYEQ